jgi:hypothetical protein
MSRGRPRNEARQTAIELGFPTYTGSACKRCTSMERYTVGGNCVKCAHVRQTEMREGARALKALMVSTPPWENQVDSEPEAVLEEDEARDEIDEVPAGETDEEREARRDAAIEDLM